jgi:hypothetical protein
MAMKQRAEAAVREAAVAARARNKGRRRTPDERAAHDALHSDIYLHAHALEQSGLKVEADNLRRAGDKFYRESDTTMLRLTWGSARRTAYAQSTV